MRIDGPTWPEQKSKFPFGQVPVLELDDGRMLAQSGAIGERPGEVRGDACTGCLLPSPTAHCLAFIPPHAANPTGPDPSLCNACNLTPASCAGCLAPPPTASRLYLGTAACR